MVCRLGSSLVEMTPPSLKMVVDFRNARDSLSASGHHRHPRLLSGSWTAALTKKAQLKMYFLWQLRKFNLPKTMMVHFYTAITESILTSSITIWYDAATAKDKGRLQRIFRWSAVICHPSGTCTPPGAWGVQERLWPSSDTKFFWEAAVHQDHRFKPHLTICCWPRQ